MCMQRTVGSRRNNHRSNCVDGQFVTVNCVGNPRATRSSIVRMRVFPAASAKKTCVTVHVPDWLALGILTLVEPFAAVFGAKLAAADCLTAPEGLRKTAWKVVAADRTSASLKL